MIPGNTNTYTVVEQRLDPPVLATRVRVVPYSEHVRTVCMRVELVGSRWQGKYMFAAWTTEESRFYSQ
jgi:discoidin domain receptor family protein 2